MSWLRRILVLLSVLVILFLIRQFVLLYPSTIASHTSAFVSVSPSTNKNTTPRLAYLVSGSAGDGGTLKRILQAIYHPNNVYVVHLDRAASDDERNKLSYYITSHDVFLKVGNVKMIDKPNVVSENGPTKIASVLHAAAVLLKESGRWDWFINLDASSYPLATQDDLLHVLSKVPRHLSFVDHARQNVWIHEDNTSEITISDRGLYMSEGGVTILSEKREIPTFFNIYIGASLVGLTRSFVEYCVWSWNSLPRTLLMYSANSVSSAETYFQTILCNTLEFRENVVKTDLHFTARDDADRPRHVRNDDYGPMWKSYAPFARKFDGSISCQVLDLIDESLLFRGPGMLVPGGWCAGADSSDHCTRVGDVTEVKPGPGAIRLRRFFDRLVRNGTVLSPQCKKFG